MAEAISTLILAVFAVEVAASTISTIITIATFVASTAVSLMAQRKPSRQAPPPGSQMTRFERAPRVYAIGRVMLAGNEVYRNANPVSGAYQWSVAAICEGPVDGFEQIWFADGEVVTLAQARETPYMSARFGLDVVVKPAARWYFQNVTTAVVQLHSGAVGQPASNYLMAEFPSTWTPAHRLDGVAYVVTGFSPLNQTQFTRVYAGGATPNVRALVRARKLRDPRNLALSQFSRNSACAIFTYLLLPQSDGGAGFALSELATDEFAAAADVCDQWAWKPGERPERRWSCDAVWTSAEDPKDVLRRLCETAMLEVYERSDGLIGVRGGRWQPPAQRFDAREIVEIELEQGPDVFVGANVCRVTWRAPDHGWPDDLIEGTEVTDDAAIIAAGRRIYASFDGAFVNSHHQARCLAAIKLRRLNANWRGRVVTRMSGLRAWDDSCVELVYPEIGIDQPIPMRQAGPPALDFARGTITWTLAQTTESEWVDAPYAEPPPLPPPSDMVSRVRQPAAIFAATEPDGASLCRVHFYVTPPTRGDVGVRIQYWTDGQAGVTQTTKSSGVFAELRSGAYTDIWLPAGQTSAWIGGLPPGRVIRYWAWTITPDGYLSEHNTAWVEGGSTHPYGSISIPSIAASRATTPVAFGQVLVDGNLRPFWTVADGYNILYAAPRHPLHARTRVERQIGSGPLVVIAVLDETPGQSRGFFVPGVIDDRSWIRDTSSDYERYVLVGTGTQIKITSVSASGADLGFLWISPPAPPEPQVYNG